MGWMIGGFDSQQGPGISLHHHPDQHWGPPSLLINGYQGFFSWG